MQRLARLGAAFACVAATVSAGAASIPSIASAHVSAGSARAERAAMAKQHKLDATAAVATNLAPKVVKTNTAPTGYEVTFRYYDPTATSVRRGWSANGPKARPARLSRQARWCATAAVAVRLRADVISSSGPLRKAALTRAAAATFMSATSRLSFRDTQTRNDGANPASIPRRWRRPAPG